VPRNGCSWVNPAERVFKQSEKTCVFSGLQIMLLMLFKGGESK
jgi:hypothetical protein